MKQPAIAGGKDIAMAKKAPRKAKSLETLLKQVNARWPKRSKASDGWIGDTAHSARKSDHNPDADGIVRAYDFTHDPKNGPNSETLANALLASCDPRIKYVISNKKIASGNAGPKPWAWRAYTGSNPHSKHVHVSVVSTAKGDDGGAWNLSGYAGKADPSAPPVDRRKILKRGDRGPEVARAQSLLKAAGAASLSIDEQFGPATEIAVQLFQKKHGLEPDGRIGQYTWESLDSYAPPKPKVATVEARSYPVAPPAAEPVEPAGKGGVITLVIAAAIAGAAWVGGLPCSILGVLCQ